VATQKHALINTTIGKKLLMALTGFVMLGFVVGHMLGNLQIYLGADTLNAYAAWLYNHPALVWGTRIVLLICVSIHVFAWASTWLRSKSARTTRYSKKPVRTASNIASRSMRFSGPAILGFIIYHLLHFTVGVAHSDFIEHDVFHNVVSGFSNPIIAAVYIFSMAMLGLHLVHGVWSAFQTMGLNNSTWTPRIRVLATLVAGALALGNISIPVSVLCGWIN